MEPNDFTERPTVTLGRKQEGLWVWCIGLTRLHSVQNREEPSFEWLPRVESHLRPQELKLLDWVNGEFLVEERSTVQQVG